MNTARHWRLQGQRYRLAGNDCRTCQRALFPPRQFCPYCGSAVGPSGVAELAFDAIFPFAASHPLQIPPAVVWTGITPGAPALVETGLERCAQPA